MTIEKLISLLQEQEDLSKNVHLIVEDKARGRVSANLDHIEKVGTNGSGDVLLVSTEPFDLK